MAIGDTEREMADEHPDLPYGTAPFPVADDQPLQRGSGFISGNVIGIPNIPWLTSTILLWMLSAVGVPILACRLGRPKLST